MSEDIRIKGETEAFHALYRELVRANLGHRRGGVETADCNLLKAKIACLEAKVDALLALVLSHAKEGGALARKVDTLFQSIEGLSTGFGEGGRGVEALNTELQRLEAARGETEMP